MDGDTPIASPTAPDVAITLRRQGEELADAIRAAQTAGYCVDSTDLNNIVVSATGVVKNFFIDVKRSAQDAQSGETITKL